MPSKKRSFTRVPFNRNGDMLSFSAHANDYEAPPQYYRDEHARRAYSVVWLAADDFDTVLTLRDSYRGRSAANFRLTDPEGHEYTMFLTDFVDAVKQGVRVGGQIAGRFEFVKRGQNYGVRLLESTAVSLVNQLDGEQSMPWRSEG